MRPRQVPEVSIDDLLNYEQFVQLIISFNKLDKDYSDEKKTELKEVISYQTYNVELSEPYYDVVNEVSAQDFITTLDRVVELNLYDDYLYPALDDILVNEIGRMELRRKAELKYSNQEKEGFYNEILEEYSMTFKKIDKCTFHNENIKDKLRGVVLEIKDYLFEQIDNLSQIEKIPLEMKNEDIAILFGRLHLHGYIGGISIPNLALLISRYISQKGRKSISPTIRNKIVKYSKKSSLNEIQQSNLMNLLND